MPSRIRVSCISIIALGAWAVPAFAAPVAVNDAYSVNEDAALVISTTPFLTESFDLPLNDTRGFTFVPHIFGSSGTAGPGTGAGVDVQGNPPGGLQVIQNFRTTVGANRSAGWQNTFAVGAAQSVRVSVDYRATTGSGSRA